MRPGGPGFLHEVTLVISRLLPFRNAGQRGTPTYLLCVLCALCVYNTACLPDAPAYDDNFFLMTTTPTSAYGEPYCDGSRAYNRVLFVDDDVVGGNGSSWSNAYGDLQDAITASSSGTEIWVAAGIYKPTSTTDRTITFNMVDGTGIHGGFAGNERLCAERNVAINVTVLSGDIDGDDTTDANGITTNYTGQAGANSYQVLTVDGLSGAFSGLTVTAGNADAGAPEPTGGGLLQMNRSTITGWQLTFAGNRATTGGAIRNDSGDTVTLADSTFSGNNSTAQAGAFQVGGTATLSDVTLSNNNATTTAGALNVGIGGELTLTRGTFQNNVSGSAGGALRVNQGTASITDSLFSGNSNTSNSGGAVQLQGSTVTIDSTGFIGNASSARAGAIWIINAGTDVNITNSTFTGNTANTNGGALRIDDGSTNLVNVTIAGNTSTTATGGGLSQSGGTVTVSNSILFGNSEGTACGTGVVDLCSTGGTLSVDYSLVNTCGSLTACNSGTGNLSSDPLFLNTGDANGADDTDRTSDDGYSLASTSPAIGTGNNDLFNAAGATATDITGGSRFNGVIDMGAYER